MTDPFDWQTEDEGEWPEDSTAGSSANSGRNWRRWLLIFIPLIFLVGAGVYWQAQQRVERAKSARETDILSSYGLIREAAEQRDVEVLTALLSGADLNWARAQQDLAQNGWLWERDVFGLNREPGSLEVVDFTFSPELNSAEITTEETYVLNSGVEVSQRVTLRHTDVFRSGARWLWAPPKNEFWGGLASGRATGEFITLIYPQRDKEIAEKLLGDFDRLIKDLCKQSDYCSSNIKIQIHFSNEPEDLKTTWDNYVQYGYQSELIHLPDGRLSMTLPTPTVVGIPVDALGYQAILSGYGRLIAGTLFNDFLAADCCGNSSMRQAVIRSMLQQVGLFPWSNIGQTVTGDIDHDFDLVTLCAGGINQEATLWRYDTVRQSWSSAISSRPIRSMQPIPGGRGAAMLEITPEIDQYRARIYIWQDERQLELYDRFLTGEELDDLRWQVRERENRLIVELPNVKVGLIEFTVFDLNQCDDSGCLADEYQLAGIPTWSPDGSQRLLHQQGMIWQNQGVFSVPVAQGERPFWIDNIAFGYLNQIGDETVVAYKAQSGTRAEIVLTTEDLRAALPEEFNSQMLVIGHIAVDPQNPDSWIILSFLIGEDGNTEEALLYQFNLSEPTVTLLEVSQNLRSFDLAGNGSRLAINRYDVDDLSWKLSIFSIRDETNEPYTLTAGHITASPPWYGWSPDGKWLSMLNQGVLTLYNFADQEEFSFNTPSPGCSQTSWIARN